MSDRIIMSVPYFQVPNDIFDIDASTHEKIVYIYLCRCCNHGGSAFPSYKTIGEKCGISKSTAIRAVKGLERAGLIKKKYRKNSNDENMSNIYEVVIPGSVTEKLPSVTEKLPSVRGAPYKEIIIKK